MKYQLIITAFLLLNLLNGNIFAQNDSIPHKIIPINFKVGINTNYLIRNSDFEGGYTGWGIFLEPYMNKWVSFLVSFNFSTIRTKSNKFRLIEFEKLKTRENFIVFRYHIKSQKVRIFIEDGIGTWGHDISYFLVGFGTDFNTFKSLHLTLALDYSFAGYRWLDVGGGGWSSSFLKLTISLSHLFKFRLKGGPVPENPH